MMESQSNNLINSPQLIEELRSLREVNMVLGGPTFIQRRHWVDSQYNLLCSRGLVEWGEPPQGFDDNQFAGVEITKAGRAFLDQLEGVGR